VVNLVEAHDWHDLFFSRKEVQGLSEVPQADRRDGVAKVSFKRTVPSSAGLNPAVPHQTGTQSCLGVAPMWTLISA